MYRFICLLVLIFIASCKSGETKKNHNVSISYGSGGTGSSSNLQITEGSIATITIQPKEGYAIAKVTGCNGSLNGNVYTTGNILNSCNIDVSFSQNIYTVSTISPTGGTISPSEAKVTHNSIITFNFETKNHYTLHSVVGCDGKLNGNTYVTGPITKNCTIQTSYRESNTSYVNYKNIGLVPTKLPYRDVSIRAYGNFDTLDKLDLFVADSTYKVNLPSSQATPSNFEFFTLVNGSYVINKNLVIEGTGCIHPRKAVVADFNSDKKPDIFVACHGYDQKPWPGETNKIILSQPNNKYIVNDASTDVGFFHSASAADLNGDGHIDVVVTNHFDKERVFTLLNNGQGQFVREVVSRMPKILNDNYYTIELLDINEDGLIDLLLGGDENLKNSPTLIFLNPGNNNFYHVQPIVIPSVSIATVVLDFTVTGSGKNRTLWINRTSVGYDNRVIQKIIYPSLESSVVLNNNTKKWIVWIIPSTIDGKAVITSDNLAEDFSVLQ